MTLCHFCNALVGEGCSCAFPYTPGEYPWGKPKADPTPKYWCRVCNQQLGDGGKCRCTIPIFVVSPVKPDWKGFTGKFECSQCSTSLPTCKHCEEGRPVEHNCCVEPGDACYECRTGRHS